jgi:multidrug efflux system membrane fusion protein
MPIEITVIGAAEPFSSVAIRAQTTGQLTSVNFTEGDDVMAGQVLFTLDRRPLESALQQAQANLDRDLAQAANAAQQGEALRRACRARHRHARTGGHLAHFCRGAERDR